MNKRSLRSFALGILLSVSLIGIFYFSAEKNSAQEPMNEQEAKSFLEEKGFIILSKDEYNKLEGSIKEAKEPGQESDIMKTMNLEITRGMVSGDIASLLEDNKIIDDADQFAIYLKDNGYSKRIQLGVFELKSGMSYKEIANIITKS